MKEQTEPFESVTQAAARWGVSSRRVRALCGQGLIQGAVRSGSRWRIPLSSPRPSDGRKTRGLEIRPAFRPVFREVDALRDEFARRRPLTEGEQRRIEDEFTVEYTHDSNAIEGNTLTLSETARVLEGMTIDKKPLKDHLEAIGHRDAFRYLLRAFRDKIPLTEWFVREIHMLVLADRPEDRGAYRKINVKILGAHHVPPEPFLVPQQMEELMVRLVESRKHPIEKAALFHVLFEAVHPFVDGNGRTGRLLLNFLLMQEGYPAINVKYADRHRYYDAFTAYHRDQDDTKIVLLVAEYVASRLKERLRQGPPLGTSVRLCKGLF